MLDPHLTTTVMTSWNWVSGYFRWWYFWHRSSDRLPS